VIFLVLISALTKVGNPRFITPTFLFGVSFLFLFLGLAIYPTKLLVNKAICYLGRISFSIYLIHFAVIKLLNPFLKTLMLPGLESTMLFMGTLVISCAIASLLYRYVETVGQEFGRGFIKRLENS
jgi:peptidoglycan/LPS O-acetylase OafA/YrhL